MNKHQDKAIKENCEQATNDCFVSQICHVVIKDKNGNVLKEYDEKSYQNCAYSEVRVTKDRGDYLAPGCYRKKKINFGSKLNRI